MNAQTATPSSDRRHDDRRTDGNVTPIRAYRERDFGVGYGRSSGYAAERRYTDRTYNTSLYRCA